MKRENIFVSTWEENPQSGENPHNQVRTENPFHMPGSSLGFEPGCTFMKGRHVEKETT